MNDVVARTESIDTGRLSLGYGEDVEGGQVGSMPSQLVSFGIGEEQYGVDIIAVREIKGWAEVTPLPCQPQYVRGVLNLRGVVVPIIDLRCRLGQGLTDTTPLHVLIVVQVGATLFGLLADRVHDIVPLDAAEVKPVPDVAQTQRSSLLSGLFVKGETTIAIVDLPNLFSAEIDEFSENKVHQSHRVTVTS